MKEFATLAEFAEFAKQRAAAVETATQLHPIHFERGSSHERAGWIRTFLNPDPNEDECAFCRAQATCPAARAKLEAAVGAGFDVIDETTLAQVHDTDDTTLGRLMSITGLLEDWIKAVRAETERRLLLGEAVDGFGLELGRQGNRAWKDTKEVTRLLREQFRLKLEDAFDLSLKSPTSVEKLTKGKDAVLSERRWAKLQDLISRSEPVPSVKPSAKIKTPYSVVKPDESAFETVREGPEIDDTPLY